MSTIPTASHALPPIRDILGRCDAYIDYDRAAFSFRDEVNRVRDMADYIRYARSRYFTIAAKRTLLVRLTLLAAAEVNRDVFTICGFKHALLDARLPLRFPFFSYFKAKSFGLGLDIDMPLHTTQMLSTFFLSYRCPSYSGGHGMCNKRLRGRFATGALYEIG